MSFYGPESVYDMSHMGLGVFEGYDAIRGFLGDWFGSYEELDDQVDEIVEVGRGVVVAALREIARPSGSPTRSRVQAFYALVIVWRGGTVARITVYPDADEARRAAEGLAKGRG